MMDARGDLHRPGSLRYAAALPSDGEGRDSTPPDSEMALRHLKATESVTAALEAAGLRPVGEIAALITEFVKGQTKSIPASQLTAGSGPMATSAAAGVGQYLAAMTPEQRTKAQQGGTNPTDPAVMAKLAHALHGGAARGPNGGTMHGDNDSSPNSDTYGRALSDKAVVASLSREGFSARQINVAFDFARSLGLPGREYAGFFVGASDEMRHAIRGALKDNKPITDDKVKSPHDATAVIGLIRAGKLKPDDPRIPQSVRTIIDDMKKDGIDPSKTDHGTIRNWFKKHPHAIEDAKGAIKQHEKKDAGLSLDQTKDKAKLTREDGIKVAAKPKPNTDAAPPKEKTSTLAL